MNDFPRVSEGILGEQDTAKTNTELFLSVVEQYFPEAIKDGEVDFTALKEEMGEFAEIGSEHYDFTWAGKQAAKKEAQADIFGKSLRYKSERSLNPDTTENLYIEGDNLEALKLLRRNYHGMIKLIYIDPPYNTKDDRIYRDDYTLTDEELSEISGDLSGEDRLQKTPKDSARYHTNWLNMMFTRLKIARDLLSDSGAIFIHIDENEVFNLQKMCHMVFGEKNELGTIVWDKRNPKGSVAGVAYQHESILVFCKDIVSFAKVDFSKRKEHADSMIANAVYSFADKRLNKQNERSFIIVEEYVTDKLPLDFQNDLKTLFSLYIDYETILNRNNKHSYRYISQSEFSHIS